MPLPPVTVHRFNALSDITDMLAGCGVGTGALETAAEAVQTNLSELVRAMETQAERAAAAAAAARQIRDHLGGANLEMVFTGIEDLETYTAAACTDEDGLLAFDNCTDQDGLIAFGG